jgi:hypothetical protein
MTEDRGARGEGRGVERRIVARLFFCPSPVTRHRLRIYFPDNFRRFSGITIGVRARQAA